MDAMWLLFLLVAAQSLVLAFAYRDLMDKIDGLRLDVQDAGALLAELAEGGAPAPDDDGERAYRIGAAMVRPQDNNYRYPCPHTTGD